LLCIDSIQIYWFGPLLGGVAGAKLYDVTFVSSSVALQLLKTKLERLVQRFTRPPADIEEASPERWSTVTREDGGVWRENSLYRTRSLLVDRAVQSYSELTTKTVAENCLAVTADAVSHHHSPPDNDEATPIVSRDSVITLDEDTVAEEIGYIEEISYIDAVRVRRRDSYQQAIMNTDNLYQPTDFEDGQTVSAAVDEIQQSTLETLSELEEPDVDDAVKEPGFPEETTAEEDEVTEASVDEILECEKEADRTDASSTRADILDNGFDELDITVAEVPPTCQTETSHSPSASVEDDFTVYDGRGPESSHLPEVSPSLSEHEVENDVWTSHTPGDIQPPDCTANELEKPDTARETAKQDSSVCIAPTLDQPEDGHSTVSKLSSSPPPPPPIDVIAIDVTEQLLSEDLPRDVDEERSDSEGEYRHSPLGGAMPESDDSSVGEFVFP